MNRKHDFDAAWKSILEAFEVEVVEILFPEIYDKISWEKGTESLDKELLEIQKEIFHQDASEKIISDKIIKVYLKDNKSKILFIHVEVQSYSSENNSFGERMFRYFYRIWDKFRYKNNDTSEIVAAAIYTYKGDRGKDTRYVYKPLDLEEEILTYNFRIIDVEKIDLSRINENNPLKLVFKMAKELLKLGASDEEVYNAKIKLANELSGYDKVKNKDQIKALVYFLEYLFLIQDEELERRYKEFKGGKIKMTVDEVRDMYNIQKGKEEGIKEGERKGIEVGKLEESKQSIIDFLSDIGLVNEGVMNIIEKENNLDTLRMWNKIAARSNSIEEFIEKINS